MGGSNLSNVSRELFCLWGNAEIIAKVPIMNKFHSWDKKGVIRFAIIYKNTTVREGEVCSDVTGESYIAFPNFFTEYTTIFIPSSKGRVKVNVFNSSGQLTESTDEEGKFEPGAKYAERIYFVNLVILKNLRQ